MDSDEARRIVETATNRVTEAACVYPGPERWTPGRLTDCPDEIQATFERREVALAAIDSVARSYLDHEDAMIRHKARVIWLLGWTLRSELRGFPELLCYPSPDVEIVDEAEEPPPGITGPHTDPAEWAGADDDEGAE
jgi:hypothetical protein